MVSKQVKNERVGGTEGSLARNITENGSNVRYDNGN